MASQVNVIVTGATGMVGEGVLHECLLHNEVAQVLVINRKPCGVQHPKLKEIIHNDFHDFSAIESQLTGYNACFFCLGVSSVGMKEEQYYNLTYSLTIHVASTLAKLNPDMTFCYVSGSGTDSTEAGRLMWARVKGKTENDLAKLPFRQVFNFRPAAIEATRGLKNVLPYYKYFSWLFPIVKLFAPNAVVKLSEVGLAMINTVTKGYEKQILEVSDIKILAAR
ncbi:NAD-dependent epimerase/dehydratase family protein [Emticicia sp. 21SJ11W-3]|uniref:NAD-dependent epimerase/dehydratase family protein n=1 Tax=Emticicia sp. 21SJ11W-3 TaxID=2916755 RepID=UPI0020A0AFC3|nr:NAD-dependent epimerase/dehydratase family protein [Emticicia sp. 21SJ11W-3]UTA69800.1 NAD-dependent epimerase/dehydratase family protein [Emticicia sp. 21SJ11W-3]